MREAATTSNCSNRNSKSVMVVTVVRHFDCDVHPSERAQYVFVCVCKWQAKDVLFEVGMLLQSSAESLKTCNEGQSLVVRVLVVSWVVL